METNGIENKIHPKLFLVSKENSLKFGFVFRTSQSCLYCFTLIDTACLISSELLKAIEAEKVQ